MDKCMNLSALCNRLLICLHTAKVLIIKSKNEVGRFITNPTGVRSDVVAERFRVVTQTLRVMKLTVCFLFIGLMNVNARGLSQSISFSGENVSLESIIEAVEKQTDYLVFCNKDVLKKSTVVSLNVVNASLNEFLDLALKDQPLVYEIVNKTIAITEKHKLEKISSLLGKTIYVPDHYFPIKGRIVDSVGNPVPNTTITVKGKNIKAAADDDGNFTVNATQGDILVITSVGFETREIKINDVSNTYTVRLQLKKSALDEVVVVAYGSTTKRELTGSVSIVKGKEIQNIPSVSVANLLQGRVAGMDVTNMSGSPGGGGIGVVIRGYNSLDVEQERRYSSPLWVVDGVPLNSFTSPVTGTNLLTDINPDMIESIQVLKDASAAAIYGSRAANGVIIVTTKKGLKNQKSSFSVNASQTVSILPTLPTITTGNEERWVRLRAFQNNPSAYVDPETQRYIYPTTLKEVYDNPGSSLDYFWEPQTRGNLSNGMYFQDSLNSYYNNATNFFPMYYERGKVTNANFQTFGGDQKMTYGIGAGIYNEAGVLKGTGFNRIDLNTSMTVAPTSWITVDARLNASLSNRKRGYKPDSEYLQSAPQIETVPGDPFKMSSLLPGEGSEVWNYILSKLSKTNETNKSTRVRSNIKVSFNLLPGLVFSTSGAADYSQEKRNYFTPSDVTVTRRNKTMGEAAINLMALNENLLSFQKTINGDHNFSAVAGLSYQYDRMEYNGGSAENIPTNRIYYASPLLPSLGQENVDGTINYIALQRYQSDLTEKSLISYFGRVEYNFRQKYLLSLAFRRDGSSVFGANNKWGTFPSIGTGYNFADDLKWSAMNFGKIRASWGRSGMQFYKPYLALGVLNVGMPYQGNANLIPDWFEGLYNQDLSWEETDQYDIGIDLDFWDSRLSIVSDYYYRYTDRLLNRVGIPGGGTYTSYYYQWRNAAAISNEGIELMVRYEIIRKPAFYWKIGVNGAKNWNRFAKSYNNRDDAMGGQGRIIGKPLNGIWVYQTNGFVNNQSDLPLFYNSVGQSNYYAPNFNPRSYYQPGDYFYLDVNGSGDFGNSDYINAGSALPVVSGGLVNEFRYKNFDCNFNFTFQLGRHILNNMTSESVATDLSIFFIHPLLYDYREVSFWTQKGDEPTLPKNQLEAFAKNMFSQPTARFVQKVNWLKWKTMTLGYNFRGASVKQLGFSQLRLFLTGENLVTITNYKGLDPETVDLATGVDMGMNYPLARRFTFGITANF